MTALVVLLGIPSFWHSLTIGVTSGNNDKLPVLMPLHELNVTQTSNLCQGHNDLPAGLAPSLYAYWATSGEHMMPDEANDDFLNTFGPGLTSEVKSPG